MKRSIAVLLVVTGACGTVRASGVAGKTIQPLPRPALTGTVGALTVAQEDIGATTKQFTRSYANAISVYSLRHNGLLEATLQVSRFKDASRLRRSPFRRGLVEQLSTGTRAQVVRVDRTDVNVTRTTGQRLFVWFGGRDVFVLSVRDGYRARYALLRAVIAGVNR